MGFNPKLQWGLNRYNILYLFMVRVFMKLGGKGQPHIILLFSSTGSNKLPPMFLILNLVYLSYFKNFIHFTYHPQFPLSPLFTPCLLRDDLSGRPAANHEPALLLNPRNSPVPLLQGWGYKTCYQAGPCTWVLGG